MFKKIQRVSTRPSQPTLIWDGECDFCKYWVTVWQIRTAKSVVFQPFQEVHDRFVSIPLKEFKKASRFIEIDGAVYSGPDSAYRSFLYFNSAIRFPHRWYHQSSFFRSISNHAYNWIAKNRPLMFGLTKLLWGSNPLNRKPYWLAWIIGLFLLFLGLIKILT